MVRSDEGEFLQGIVVVVRLDVEVLLRVGVGVVKLVFVCEWLYQ